MAPSAKAIAHVRAKPVMREMMVQMLMMAAEVPTSARMWSSCGMLL